MPHIEINGRKVGDGQPCYVIAEIGANHNGDMSLARELIDAAKECGADAVKFQLFERNTFHPASFLKREKAVAEELAKYKCDQDDHAALKQYADKVGIDFASTAFNHEDVDFLTGLGVAFLKIASMDADNQHFIRYIAEKGFPTIFSTGLATWAEIADSVECFKPGNIGNLCLMHVIALYPPQDSQLNLRKIEMMRTLFGVPVGYSDHSLGYSIPLASVALGACAIEKHFTLDKNLPGWDHKVSANPEELRIICSEAKRIHAALGTGNPDITADEIKKREQFRRSVIATAPIAKGETLSRDKLFFKRPGTGITPRELDYVAGRVAKRDIAADEMVSWDDLI